MIIDVRKTVRYNVINVKKVQHTKGEKRKGEKECQRLILQMQERIFTSWWRV